MKHATYSIEVVNIRHDGNCEYIGRPSPLGNPLAISRHASRDIVCDHYDEWFHLQIELNNPLVLNELKRLHRLGKQTGKLKLGCFCKPRRRCHGDTIKKWMENNFDFLEVLCEM